MSDIEIIVRISEEVYEHILEAKSVPDILGVDMVNTINAVKNGTPLPKGHGDLIDRKVILCDDCSCEQCGHTDECFKLLAPTIIKADKDYLEVLCKT